MDTTLHTNKRLFPTAASITMALAMVGVSACSSKSAVAPKMLEPQVLSEVDTSKPEKFKERLGVGNPDIGGWLDPYERGSFFKPATRQHPDSAIIYIYRPDSSWSRQEVVGASIFLNGQRLKGLKNNHYYPIELPAGNYRLAIRRPLPPVYLLKGKVMDFTVQAGKDYYLKYAEQYHIDPPDRSLGLLFERPIMQMPTADAIKEISSTRLKTPGYRFTGENPNQLAGTSLPAVSGLPLQPVNEKMRLSEAKENKVGVQFKIYNPLTW